MKLKPLCKQLLAWIILSLCLFASGQGFAQEEDSLEQPNPARPLWMRYPHVVDTGMDIYAQFLTQEVWDEFKLSPEQKLDLQAIKAEQAAQAAAPEAEDSQEVLEHPRLDGLRHRITPFSTAIIPLYGMVDNNTLVMSAK